MNFSDEHYVRIYTRDTKTWIKLGFEGQTVLMHLTRKLDKAGVLDDVDDPVSDVHVVTGVPFEIVRVGMALLLQFGVYVQRGNSLVMVKYLEAQTASKSDAVRAKEARQRKRARALSDQSGQSDQLTLPTGHTSSERGELPHENMCPVPEPTVTKRDDSSQNVTGASQNVTNRHEADRPRHPTQYNATHEQKQKTPQPPESTMRLAAPSPDVAQTLVSFPFERHPLRNDPMNPAHRRPEVVSAFGTWKVFAKQPNAILGPGDARSVMLLSRLKTYGHDSFELVLLGASQDPWVNGKKDGSEHKRLEYLLGGESPARYEELLEAGKRIRDKQQKALRRAERQLSQQTLAAPEQISNKERLEGLTRFGNAIGAINNNRGV